MAGNKQTEYKNKKKEISDGNFIYIGKWKSNKNWSEKIKSVEPFKTSDAPAWLNFEKLKIEMNFW